MKNDIPAPSPPDAGRMSEEPWTLCAQCGPDVKVDEDGCCVTCGCDALQVHGKGNPYAAARRAREENERLREALEKIATSHQAYNDPEVTKQGDCSYQIGVVDGHRCAATVARAALAALRALKEKP